MLTVQVPVAEGAHRTFAGIEKTWVADFVHGDDGFGNMNFAEVKVCYRPLISRRMCYPSQIHRCLLMHY